MGVIDEVKQRTDIVEVIGQYVSLTKAGRTFRALCPFHSEKHPSFFVYPEQQTWHCFGACNSGGDAFSFVMKKEGMGFGEALRLLAQRAGVTIPSRIEPGAEEGEKERLCQVNQAAAQYFHNLLLNSPTGEKARSYVASRGLSTETTTEFQLGFSPNSWDALKQYLVERGYTEPELITAGLIIEGESGGTHDRFRNRLMFPIFDIRGRVTGFGARALDDSLPKYLNSPQTPIFDKSSTIYGINLAAATIKQQDMAVIVEGYMDVITAHQNGFQNVVASMGTAVTEKQFNTLRRLNTKTIIFALDADVAGTEALLRAEETARKQLAEDRIPVFYRNMIVTYANVPDIEIKVFILPEGKDPDDVIKEDPKNWQRLVEEALPAVDYTIDTVTSRLDLTTARNKSSAVERLLPIVAEIKDNIRRDHYITKLAKLTGVNYYAIEATLKEYIARGKKPIKESATRTVRQVSSSLLEEYCLTLLLQHPELKGKNEGLLPEYFENSENREIFIAWQQANELSSIRDKLDTTIHEYLDSLIKKNIQANQIEQKYTDCVLNLRKKSLQNLLIKNAEALAVERETGGTAAELAKLEEQGIEVSSRLGEVFTQKATQGKGPRR